MKRTPDAARRPGSPGPFELFQAPPTRCAEGGVPEGEPWFPLPSVSACRHHEGMKRTPDAARRPGSPGPFELFQAPPTRCAEGGVPEGEPWFPLPAVHACRHHEGMKRTPDAARRPGSPGPFELFQAPPTRCAEGGVPEGEPWFPLPSVSACRHHEGMKGPQTQRVGPGLPGRLSCFKRRPHVAPREGFRKGNPGSPCPLSAPAGTTKG